MGDPSAATAAPLTPPRKKVTRACDTCKKRKVKCDGLGPCSRCCISADNVCTYKATYNRVRGRLAPYPRRQPPRKKPPQVATEARKDTLETRPPSKSPSVNTGQNGVSTPDVDDVEPGDASVHAFLARFSNHLARVGQGLPRNLFKRPEEHDASDSALHTRNLILPPKDAGKMYLDAYFEHGNATCRFLPPREAYEIFGKLYEGAVELSSDPGTEALVLLVMATGCVWMASWKNEPLSPWQTRALPFLQAAESRLEKVSGMYPPTVRVLQAYVVKCQCEVVLGRYNSAWMSMGWAIRLSQMVNLQREPPPGTCPLEAHYRRALFWAMFMMDRYLAIILGRPAAIHERDVTVSLSPVPDDAVAASLEPQEKKLLIGSVAHYRLVKIMTKAACELYPASKPLKSETEQIVPSLEEDLQQWLKDTPDFFHPGHDSYSASPGSSFYEVPWILKRQQHTIHSAYHFANMLVYRRYLLRGFLERPRQGPRSSTCSETADRIGKCVDSAMAMVDLACSEFDVDEGRYNGTFWSTSHFIFCALSILLVYLAARPESSDEHRAAVERAVREGMRFHRKLDHGPNANAQRLLDGSQSQIAKSTGALGDAGLHREALMDGAAPVEIHRSPGAATDDEAPPVQPTHAQETASWSIPWLGEPINETVFELTCDQQDSLDLGSMGGFDMIMDIGFDNATLFGAPEGDGVFGP